MWKILLSRAVAIDSLPCRLVFSSPLIAPMLSLPSTAMKPS